MSNSKAQTLPTPKTTSKSISDWSKKLSQKEIEGVKKQFKDFDKDRNGYIDKKEFVQGAKAEVVAQVGKGFASMFDDSEFEAMFEELDDMTNGDGKLTLEELLSTAAKSKGKKKGGSNNSGPSMKVTISVTATSEDRPEPSAPTKPVLPKVTRVVFENEDLEDVHGVFKSTGHRLRTLIYISPYDLPNLTGAVIWKCEKAEGIIDYTVGTIGLPSIQDEIILSHIDLPRDWPVGDYSLQLVINGTAIHKEPFKVVKG